MFLCTSNLYSIYFCLIFIWKNVLNLWQNDNSHNRKLLLELTFRHIYTKIYKNFNKTILIR